ncbi:ABC transporter substrate-binding protein [Paracoccus kondratievae]
MLEFSRKYIEDKGGKIVGEEYLPMEGSDWTAILSNLRSAGADAVITSTAGGTPNVTLTKQLRASGISIPYANLAVDEGTAKAMGADGVGILISASYLTAIDTPENKDFIAALEKKFGGEMRTPNDLSTPQYEAVYLYKAAVEKAGSTETEAVLAAFPEVSFKGRAARFQCRNSIMLPSPCIWGKYRLTVRSRLWPNSRTWTRATSALISEPSRTATVIRGRGHACPSTREPHGPIT